MADPINSRIECNKHVARDLRRRLETRYAKGTHTRETIDRLSDQKLLDMYIRNEKLGLEHAAKQRAEKEGSE
ncbi:MAG TPA: hypothetical protein VEW05_27675 [Candidatus Polarisedimenticolia bacterium]|nr:hypothetical protein [Candidatus Polarisedimenticolia bacterium]